MRAPPPHGLGALEALLCRQLHNPQQPPVMPNSGWDDNCTRLDGDRDVTSPCPGCGGVFSDTGGPIHRYMTSSTGCWLGFGRLLAADYSSRERMTWHQLVVDSYAALHPGTGELPHQVQSVGLPLMTLRLSLENDMVPSLGTALHKNMVHKPSFHRLERSGSGALTWQHVPTAGDPAAARVAAFAWCRAVWDSYEAEQPTVRCWLRQSGYELTAGTAQRAPLATDELVRAGERAASA